MELGPFNTWFVVSEHIKQFYSDDAVTFTTHTEGEFDDQAGTYYKVDSITVFNKRGNKLSIDMEKPMTKLVLETEKDLHIPYGRDYPNYIIEDNYKTPGAISYEMFPTSYEFDDIAGTFDVHEYKLPFELFVVEESA